MPVFFVEMKMNSLFNEISGAFNSFFTKCVDICKEFDSKYKILYEKSDDSLEKSVFNEIGNQLSTLNELFDLFAFLEKEKENNKNIYVIDQGSIKDFVHKIISANTTYSFKKDMDIYRIKLNGDKIVDMIETAMIDLVKSIKLIIPKIIEKSEGIYNNTKIADIIYIKIFALDGFKSFISQIKQSFKERMTFEIDIVKKSKKYVVRHLNNLFSKASTESNFKMLVNEAYKGQPNVDDKKKIIMNGFNALTIMNTIFTEYGKSQYRPDHLNEMLKKININVVDTKPTLWKFRLEKGSAELNNKEFISQIFAGISQALPVINTLFGLNITPKNLIEIAYTYLTINDDKFNELPSQQKILIDVLNKLCKSTFIALANMFKIFSDPVSMIPIYNNVSGGALFDNTETNFYPSDGFKMELKDAYYKIINVLLAAKSLEKKDIETPLFKKKSITSSKWGNLYNYVNTNIATIDINQVIYLINQINESFDSPNDMIADLVSQFSISIRDKFEGIKFDDDNIDSILANLNTQPDDIKRVSMIMDLFDKFMSMNHDKSTEIEKLSSKSVIIRSINLYNRAIDKANNSIERALILKQLISVTPITREYKIADSYIMLYGRSKSMLNSYIEDLKSNINNNNYEILEKYNSLYGNIEYDGKNIILTVNSILARVYELIKQVKYVYEKFIINKINVLEDKIQDPVNLNKIYEDLSKLKDKQYEIPFDVNDMSKINVNCKLNNDNKFDKRYAKKEIDSDIREAMLRDKVVAQNKENNNLTTYVNYNLSAIVKCRFEIKNENNYVVSKIVKLLNGINNKLFDISNTLRVPSSLIDEFISNGFDYIVNPDNTSSMIFNSPSIPYVDIDKNISKTTSFKIAYREDTTKNAIKPIDVSNGSTIPLNNDRVFPWIFKDVSNAFDVSSKVYINDLTKSELLNLVLNLINIYKYVTGLNQLFGIINISKDIKIKERFNQSRIAISNFGNVILRYLKQILSDESIVSKIFINSEFEEFEEFYDEDLCKIMSFMMKNISNFDINKFKKVSRLTIVDAGDIDNEAFNESLSIFINIFDIVDNIINSDKLFNKETIRSTKINIENNKSEFYMNFLRFMNINMTIPLSLLNETGFAALMLFGIPVENKDKETTPKELIQSSIDSMNKDFGKIIDDLIQKRIPLKIGNLSKDNSSIVNAYSLIYDENNLSGGDSESKSEQINKIMKAIHRELVRDGISAAEFFNILPKLSKTQKDLMVKVKMFNSDMIEYIKSGKKMEIDKSIKTLIQILTGIDENKEIPDPKYIYLMCAFYIAMHEHNEKVSNIQSIYKKILKRKISDEKCIDAIKSLTDKDIIYLTDSYDLFEEEEPAVPPKIAGGNADKETPIPQEVVSQSLDKGESPIPLIRSVYGDEIAIGHPYFIETLVGENTDCDSLISVAKGFDTIKPFNGNVCGTDCVEKFIDSLDDKDKEIVSKYQYNPMAFVKPTPQAILYGLDRAIIPGLLFKEGEGVYISAPLCCETQINVNFRDSDVIERIMNQNIIPPKSYFKNLGEIIELSTEDMMVGYCYMLVLFCQRFGNAFAGIDKEKLAFMLCQLAYTNKSSAPVVKIFDETCSKYRNGNNQISSIDFIMSFSESQIQQ